MFARLYVPSYETDNTQERLSSYTILMCNIYSPFLKIKGIDFYKRERTSLNRNLFSGEKYLLLLSDILDRECFIHRISKIKH